MDESFSSIFFDQVFMSNEFLKLTRSALLN